MGFRSAWKGGFTEAACVSGFVMTESATPNHCLGAADGHYIHTRESPSLLVLSSYGA